jgi:D-lactate dehydrogenase
MMPKIAFFDVFPAEQPILEAGIRNAFPNEAWEASFNPKSLTLELLPQFTDVDVLSLNTNLPQNQAMLGTLTNLKFIATRSTGYNHFDLPYLQTRKIPLCNVPSYSEQSVAECVFLLLLSLTKKLTLAINNTQKGLLKKDASFLGMELKGKTFGVWGTGATGIATLEIAKGFGMTLIANSRTIKPELVEQLGVTYVSFDELLAQSDFLSLHAPLNAQTQGFFGEDALLKMKPSSFLINTARGGVVDMPSLLKVLEMGHLSGVGLDVLPHEHLLMRRSQLMETVLNPETHQADCNALLVEQLLMLHPKVITLPHMAYFTKEALERMAQITIDNIAAWYAGNPVNIVA